MLKCEHCGRETKGRCMSNKYIFDKGVMAMVSRRRRLCEWCGYRWTTVEVNKQALKGVMGR